MAGSHGRAVHVRHYYHLYLDGDASWVDIAAEYAAALTLAQFPTPPAVGIVGRNREPAKRWLDEHMPGWTLAAEADTGYEQVTLSALQRDLPGMRGSDKVLYAHSKGAWRNMPLEDQWRRSMLWHLVFGWQNCARLLRNHQTVGCHWRDGTHYAGNFWWARADYLQTLPSVTGITEAERGRAEMWVGLGNPTVANLVEGFPPDGTEEGAQLASELLPPRPIQRRPVRLADDSSAIRKGASLAGVSPLGTPAPSPSMPFGWAGRM